MVETTAQDTASPDVRRLVTEVLESDDRLRTEAEDAELDAESLTELLSGRLHEPEAQGSLELRTRSDAARREYDAAAAAYENRTPRGLWLRQRLEVRGAIAVLTGIAIALVQSVVTGGSPSWRVFLALGGALVAAYFLWALLSDRYDAYVKSLVTAVKNAADAFATIQAELDRDLVESWVKPAIRDEVNRRAGSKYRTVMEPVEYQGLAGDDPSHTIATDARRQLEQFLEHKRYGSIGLSGPRGAGKGR